MSEIEPIELQRHPHAGECPLCERDFWMVGKDHKLYPAHKDLPRGGQWCDGSRLTYEEACRYIDNDHPMMLGI